MFIDSTKIHIRAGRGGRGCSSFYRDKYTREGVPDGGAGGKGADVIIRADRNLYSLLDFKYNRDFRAQDGAHGSGNKKKGKDGVVMVIRVPLGTTVKDLSTDCILRDLNKDKEEFVICLGGKGGRGNTFHHEATEGIAGEEKDILFDLKVLADVGVVGFPNAGKSTLISNVTNAHPKIAAYPFTTKDPVLGVVRKGEESFVIADIPGLIEGSSCGKGLGDKFLRHIERTKILLHLVDMAGFEGRNPIEDYRTINAELKNYSKAVGTKKQIIVANKMDLPSAKENLKKFKRTFRKKVYPISALNKQGLEELIEGIWKSI
ncbi:MAG: GTPase ObgE [Candidatus Omnitrophica bacterium]|nr:GTPase ObgE [Candidatus Omnitrophota bacterium]